MQKAPPVSVLSFDEEISLCDLFVLNYNPGIESDRFKEVVAELKQLCVAYHSSSSPPNANAYQQRIEALSQMQIICIRQAYD